MIDDELTDDQYLPHADLRRLMLSPDRATTAAARKVERLADGDRLGLDVAGVGVSDFGQCPFAALHPLRMARDAGRQGRTDGIEAFARDLLGDVPAQLQLRACRRREQGQVFRIMGGDREVGAERSGYGKAKRSDFGLAWPRSGRSLRNQSSQPR